MNLYDTNIIFLDQYNNFQKIDNLLYDLSPIFVSTGFYSSSLETERDSMI